MYVCITIRSQFKPINMSTNIDRNLEYDEGMDDDKFYAEIRKQVLLLTEDDDHEDEVFLQTTHPISSTLADKRSLKRLATSTVPIATQAGGIYFSSCWESENNGGCSVPAWLGKLWRNDNGGGTGVFIPHIVKSRRRQRSGTDQYLPNDQMN